MVNVELVMMDCPVIHNFITLITFIVSPSHFRILLSRQAR